MKRGEVGVFKNAFWLKGLKKYGSKQKLYLLEAARITTTIAETINDTQLLKRDIKPVFKSLLRAIGDERRGLALMLGADQVNAFGLLRQDLADTVGQITPLQNEYRDTSLAIWDWVEVFLRGTETLIEDDHSRVRVRLMTRFEAIQNGFFTQSRKPLNVVVAREKEKLNMNEDMVVKMSGSLYPMTIQVDAFGMMPKGTTLKEIRKSESSQFPDSYSHNREGGLFQFNAKRMNGMDWDQYLLINVDLRVNGRFLNGATFLSGHSRSSQRGDFVMRHADQVHQEEYIDYLAQLFENAVNAPSERIMKELALFEFYFSYATPYLRGSASIREFFTRGILKARNLRQVKYVDGIPIDLRAFSSPLFSDFEENYPSFYRSNPVR